jgi:hypothetical protein
MGFYARARDWNWDVSAAQRREDSTSKTLNYFPIHPLDQIRRGVESHDSPRANDRRVARFRIAADPLSFGAKHEYAKSVQFDRLAANKRCNNLFEDIIDDLSGLRTGQGRTALICCFA